MKSSLPTDCGLRPELIAIPNLVPHVDGVPSLTDAQFEALEAGIAKGASVLISAPTSTGKTLIGWWAIASAVKSGRRAVYLVSHRALAKQKFEEAQRLFLSPLLEDDRASLVYATGDAVEDASGRKVSAPLSASILIATYEKFLGCLSTGGPPRDLSDVTFVCDEVQLIGDKTRGKNVELLLTLLKRATWNQFVALSAVMARTDAGSFSDWLDLKLVRNPTREKALRLQCRTPSSVYEVLAAPNLDGIITKKNVSTYQLPNAIVSDLHKDIQNKPTIVFCMKLDDTYELSSNWIANKPVSKTVTVPAGLDLGPNLLRCLERGAAFHNAELSEEERLFVENRIASGDVEVVYATSTLAAGVNFPLGAAVFASWKRWNVDKRVHEPIDRSEFQNMAGRVGRMGQQAAEGVVVFTAETGASIGLAQKYMDLQTQDELGQGINPEDFGILALQVFAGKLCHSRSEAFDLLSSTLSASREINRNSSGVSHWKGHLDRQVDRLAETGCIIETRTRVSVTQFGLAVAGSGLKPETALFFIQGMIEFSTELSQLLYSSEKPDAENDLLFVLAHAALTCPEYNRLGGKPTRNIPWRVGNNHLVSNNYASRLKGNLFEQPWEADISAGNGALLIASWAAGNSRNELEKLVDRIRVGTVQGMSNEVSWILTGISEIISKITSPTMADESKPEVLRGETPAVGIVRKLARGLRRQAARISSGLPTDVLWMNELDLPGRPRRLSRTQVLALRDNNLARPVDLMSGADDETARRRKALDAEIDPRLANQVRDAARQWKVDSRVEFHKHHMKRAARINADSIINNLYINRGEDFEVAFSDVMNFIAVQCEKIDKKGNIAYPDFLITVENYPQIVVENKTKASDLHLVALNAATEVLTASELIGMRDSKCLTVCSPGVEASVPGLIERCDRLCVVDVCDLAEAVIRLREGRLKHDEFYNWITTPGVASIGDLPHPH